MMSKDWKFIALSLSAVALLSACQKKNNESSDASVSVFTGVWMSQLPISTYRQNAPAISAGDYEPFCLAVAEDPIAFGITRRMPWKDVVVNALLIQVDGKVSRYDPEIRSRTANPAYVEALHIGQVSNNGEFRRTTPNPRHTRSGYSYAGLPTANDPRFTLSDTSFHKDNSDQITVERMSGRYHSGREVFLRIEEKEIRSYFHAVRSCIELYRSGGFDRYQNYRQHDGDRGLQADPSYDDLNDRRLRLGPPPPPRG